MYRDKINKLNLYKERLKETIIHSEDYEEIIKRYDDKDTLFYLDPPYENGEKIFKGYSKNIDYVQLRYICNNIKGYFILSLNSSDNIKTLFKDFNIIERLSKQEY